MKNRFLSCFILILIGSMLYSQSESEQIEKTIDQWHLAAAEADFETYFSKMASESVFIGTDATENWKLKPFKAFSKPYFDRGKAWSFKSVERHVYLDRSKQFGWFDELLDTRMGICRGSGVVKLENGTWKIAHYVLSATIPNDDMQKVIELKNSTDSLYLLELSKSRVIMKE
ncbi:MAG: nuclear transport factor 2 family protein [Flavobacteriaceae bacterium]